MKDIKNKIIETGLKAWRDNPDKVSARGIAKSLGITHAAILYHFGSSERLRDAIAAEAVRIGDSLIITFLIASRHHSVDFMPYEERAKHLNNCAQ